MITPLLHSILAPVVERQRQRRTFLLAATITGTLAAAAWLLPALGLMSRPPFAVLAVLAYFLGWRLSRSLARNWEPDYTRIARDIETRHPDLHALLLTAVEQRPDPATGKLHYLQQRVITETAERARREKWIDSVPNAHVFLGQV